jgi:hypothetical protein
LVVEIQVTISIYNFGGSKVLFVGRYDPGGCPQKDSILYTPFIISLKC